MVVADEAQHVKNPYSATARQLRTIGATRARGAHRHAGGEQPLRAVGDPRLDHARAAGPPRHVPQRATPQAVESGSDPAAAERLARLVRPFLLRRRKSDPGIAPELPPKTETDRAVVAHQGAGRAVRGGGARDPGGDRRRRRHGPARADRRSC